MEPVLYILIVNGKPFGDVFGSKPTTIEIGDMLFDEGIDLDSTIELFELCESQQYQVSHHIEEVP